MSRDFRTQDELADAVGAKAIVIREGAALRTSTELCDVFVDDVCDLLGIEPEQVYVSGTYGLCFVFRNGDEASISGSGRQDENVEALLRVPYITEQFEALDPDKIRLELKEYGAWNEDELADEAQNRARFLWIAAGDVGDRAAEFASERADEYEDKLYNIPSGHLYTVIWNDGYVIYQDLDEAEANYVAS